MRPIAWVLVSFPLFLLVRGRLADYLSLAGASKSEATE